MADIKYTIEKRLEKLLGQPLNNIGRSGNMLWIEFGKEIEWKNHRGDIEKRSYYALDVQTAWRFTEANNILVAEKDFYIASSKNSVEFDDCFEWDTPGANRFDEIVRKNKDQLTSLHIARVIADNYGGLRIKFDRDYVLEIFPDDSLKEEYWRFMIFDNPSKHFVVFEDE